MKRKERPLSNEEFGIALEVLCRVFDDGAEREVYEFRDWYKPSQWLGFSRALGAFIRKRLDEQPHHQRLAALAEEWRQRYCAEHEKVTGAIAALRRSG